MAFEAEAAVGEVTQWPYRAVLARPAVHCGTLALVLPARLPVGRGLPPAAGAQVQKPAAALLCGVLGCSAWELLFQLLPF